MHVLSRRSRPTVSRPNGRWRSHSEAETDVQLRRATVGASLAGGLALTAIRVLRSGALEGLSDSHAHGLRRRGGREEYIPRDSLTFLLHAANMALAAAGPANRAERRPYLSLIASVATGAQAAVSARYLVHTLRKSDRWCPYCVTDAVTHFTTFALTLPEARDAARRMLERKTR
ncbi:hypothetical protein F6455_03005 [Proteobacteria bacterium 005FR1]|nr:hypothetical protein [Proteobacteria bacterium 005FR1]